MLNIRRSALTDLLTLPFESPLPRWSPGIGGRRRRRSRMPYIRKRTHRETVAKIVKEEDVLEHVKNLRARFYGGLEEALQSTFDYIRNSKDGGKLAYEMLKDAAVIPNNCQKVDLELQAKQ